MSSKTDALYQLLEPAVQVLGFELWGLELQMQGKYSLLRIYIDGPDGVNVDDCAAVSHQVSGVLDVEDPISGEYTLEVSSPGIDRPLFSLPQYQRYVGETIKVQLRVAFEGRRKFTGVLSGIDNDEIVLISDGHEYVLPFELIDKAQLIARL